MEIDFHFGVTYVVGRLAGLDHTQAEVVATCSQYVDDTVNSGPLNFKTGEAYNRISSSHALTDYHIALSVDERQVWVPFHFLPGNQAAGDHANAFYNRIVCRPFSEVAQAMARRCVEDHQAPHALHRLGITAHVFVDTWAHQGFAGINHPINMASGIKLQHPPERTGLAYFVKLVRKGGLSAGLIWLARPLMLRFTDRIFPMGHGTVLHYPDHPFRRWSYVNGHGRTIERDNPRDFMEAAEQLCKLIRRHQLGDPEAEVEGLPEPDREHIRSLLVEQTDDDPEVRLSAWLKAIREGKFSFGAAQPSYVEAGPGSWKYQALGAESAEISPSERFDYTPAFLSSNWKLFHDAAQAHQHDVLRDILPSFGICAI